jgi:hypothetical protein
MKSSSILADFLLGGSDPSVNIKLMDDPVSVRLHGKGNVGTQPKAEAVADILVNIKARRA